MEKRVNKKIGTFFQAFKDNVRQQAIALEATTDPHVMQLVQYVSDYPPLTLGKDDFNKNRREKNNISFNMRCCAKRANGEQCTRRKKDATTDFCGTHCKGTPNGVCSTEELSNEGKIGIWAQDIGGIVYFIDNVGNVYLTRDILQNVVKPRVCATYVKTSNNEYVIQESSA